MRNLITFLIKNSNWFLFLLLELVCFFFIFNNSSYQRSVFFNTSNIVAGKVYSISGNVSAYFRLKQNNEELLVRNVDLLQKVQAMENYINKMNSDSLMNSKLIIDSLLRNQYQYTLARVLDNSISSAENFITINKGSEDGIRPEMGVVSANGIVGFVRSVSSRNSLVQSVLNPKTQLSCKMKRSSIATTLVWDAKDYRYADLKGFPRYEPFEKGDTVITSGVSKFFPEGFLVGTVESFKAQKDDNFYTLRVRLATNFSSLDDVLVINNYTQKELINMRKEVGYE